MQVWSHITRLERQRRLSDVVPDPHAPGSNLGLWCHTTDSSRMVSMGLRTKMFEGKVGDPCVIVSHGREELPESGE